MSNFNLRFRIIDDFEHLYKLEKDSLENEGDPEGFFEIEGNGLNYGYYHNNKLEPGEEGEYLIAVWLELLLKAVLTLFSDNYVAIKDVDSLSSWVEFEKTNSDKVRVRILSVNSLSSDVLTTQKHVGCKLDDESELTIELQELKKEVVRAMRLYLEQLSSINDQYPNTNRCRFLKELLSRVDQL